MIHIPDEAFDGFAADVLTVSYHVIRNPNRDYYPVDRDGIGHSATVAAISASVMARTVNLPALTQIVGRVCWTLARHEKERTLTSRERHVAAAAWRLSDAIHGMRVIHVPRFVRPDGTTD